MKFKALKSFVSGFGTFDADQEYDVKLDRATQKMWIEHGLIEKVEVAKTEQPNQEPSQEATTETQESAQEAASETAPTEEVKPVNTDENQ